jgi:polysaccharide export outer membrane protein
MDFNVMSLKSWQTLVVSTLLLSALSGCTVTSGLKAGELPPVGKFIAENGMQFNIQPLHLANMSVPYAQLGSGSQLLNPSNINRNGPANSRMNNSQIAELLRSAKPADYRITSGDILSINLVGYPEITPPVAINSTNPYAAGFVVDQQGYIQFPLIGRIQAGGVSVPQFTANLRSRLQKYLKYSDPQVSIINYRGKKFFVDGAVQQPGEFNIADGPVSLVGAISMAGGALPTGDSNSIELIRNGKRYQLGLRDLQTMGVAPNQVYIQDGDAVHINNRDRSKVYVLGEFGEVKPLEIPEQGMSLAQVMGESKGLNPNTANAAKVYVVRDHPSMNYSDIYYVDLQSVTNLAVASRFQMQSNDMVYVDPTGLTRWSRFINSILPSASAVRMLSGL